MNNDIVEKANTYRLRYRIKNAIGFSDYSDVVYILAANVPEAPPAPQFVSSDSDGISVIVPRTLDNGGSPVTGYKLLVDSGDDFSSSFNPIASYNSELNFIATVLTDSLVVGRTYRFVAVATNMYGDSEYSLELIAGMGAKPPAPTDLARDVTIYM